MIKLTRKALIQHAHDLGARQLSTNIYKYDNDLCTLSELKPVTSNDTYDCDLCNKLIKDIKDRYWDGKYCTWKQLAYNWGVAGNNGQLHCVTIHDVDGIPLGVVYVYVA